MPGYFTVENVKSLIQRLAFALVMPGLGTALWLSACAGTAPSNASTSRLNVVSTVAPVVNIIYNIGGDKIDLVGIIPEGTDSHTFEPAPSDAVKLAKGDLIFVNGLDLEAPTVKLARATKKAGADISARLGYLAKSS